MKYRKKPVVIEAVQWLTDNYPEVVAFCSWVESRGEGSILTIPTLEGSMKCQPFDWIIKGVKGEFYPCKPDIFEATYEKAE